jgi:hypothetical protein
MAFSKKALLDMEADGLTELDIAESILNAVAIYKTIRSQNHWRQLFLAQSEPHVQPTEAT